MKQIFLFSFLLLSALTCHADQKQTVVVNGSQVQKSVKNISFQGTNVILTYADGSTQTADRSAFLIRIKGISTTGISKPKATNNTNEKCYSVDGKRISKPTQNGIYIKEGSKNFHRQ